MHACLHGACSAIGRSENWGARAIHIACMEAWRSPVYPNSLLPASDAAQPVPSISQQSPASRQASQPCSPASQPEQAMHAASSTSQSQPRPCAAWPMQPASRGQPRCSHGQAKPSKASQPAHAATQPHSQASQASQGQHTPMEPRPEASQPMRGGRQAQPNTVKKKKKRVRHGKTW